MSNYCLYVHRNTVVEGYYVGITKNVARRHHPSSYKPSRENASHFYNAILKYGWESFDTTILRDGLSFEEAIELEILTIAEYRNTYDVVYNISDGGNGGVIYKEHPRGMLGKKHTKENCERHSAFMRENNPMEYVKWGVTHEHPRGMLGHNHTDETKKRISETCRDKIAKLYRVTYRGEVFHCKGISEITKLVGVGYEGLRKLIASGEAWYPKRGSRYQSRQDLVGLTIIVIDEKTPC